MPYSFFDHTLKNHDMLAETLHTENELLEHNVMNTEQLFELYNSLHFIYPAKMEKLSPVFELVKKNWEKALKLNFPLFWVSTIANNPNNILSTGATWQYSNTGMIGQHLASNHPVGSRLIFLGMLDKIIKAQHKGFIESYQVYYRPQNKYSARVFEGITAKAGKDFSEIIPYHYFEVPFIKNDCREGIEIVEITNGHHPDFIDFLLREKGEIFIEAQELNSGDINLNKLNNRFKRSGLKRTRRIFAAISCHDHKIYGVTVINESSLGLNFSFFENSCELILRKNTSAEFLLKVAYRLLYRASKLKSGSSSLHSLLVLTDPVHSELIEKLHGKLTRNYNLFMILKGGYEMWYDHVDELTNPVFQRFINHSYEKNS